MTDTSHHTAASSGSNARVPVDIWPIRSAVAIAKNVEICRKTGQMGLITGPSGIGKTTAACATVAALAGADVEAHYVTMTRAHDELLPGLLRIAAAIGAPVHPSAGKAGAYDALTNHMATCWQHGSVLVLDEAQFMSNALIDGLRNIADELRTRRRAGRAAGRRGSHGGPARRPGGGAEGLRIPCQGVVRCLAASLRGSPPTRLRWCKLPGGALGLRMPPIGRSSFA